MRNVFALKSGRRSLRVSLRSVVALGATSALMVGGLAFVAVAPAGAASTLTVSSITSPQTSESNLSFTVTTAPAVTGDIINITSGCSLGGTSAETTDGSGVATFSSMYVKLGTSCTLTATDNTGANSGASAQSNSFTVQAGAASKIAYTTAPPSAGTLGVALTPAFKVSIEDQDGNVVTSGTGSVDTIAITSSCTLGGTTTETAAAGVATFNALSINSGSSCTLVATDTLGPDTGFTATSSAVNVASATPTKLGFTVQPPVTASSGVILPSFAVSVEQSNGVVVTSGTGSTDAVVLTSACSPAGTLTATAVAGVATFTAVSLKTIGASCTLVATDQTRALSTATSNAIAVGAGAATKVVFSTVPPATVTTASTALATFRVAVEDVNGNVVATGTGSTDNIAITSTCALGGTTTSAAFAGVATFSALTINVTGACVLTATDTTRTLTTATNTTTVGTPQAAVVLKTVKGYAGSALTLSTTGGTGTGAVTYTVTNGTATGCVITGNTLKASKIGTCLVTATKAGSTTYIATSSAVTTVTFVTPFKARHVAGTAIAGRTTTVKVIGSGFYSRPRIIFNVGGVSARVTGDSGRVLTLRLTARANAKSGVHKMVIILANGKRSAVAFRIR